VPRLSTNYAKMGIKLPIPFLKLPVDITADCLPTWSARCNRVG
jgi:hypothetical protein